MANVNKVLLIGRLTRDPEQIASGRGAKFGFAVNRRTMNTQTQQWEDVPVFLDCELWNRGEAGQQATRFLETVRKGHQIFIEGSLKMDSWEDKNGGGKRTAIRIVVESFQYLEAKSGESQPRTAAPAQTPGKKVPSHVPPDVPDTGVAYQNDDDIPF